MIRLARVWYNFVADYHRERVLDHERRRDRALRKLEKLERRVLLRQLQDALARSDARLARRGLRPRAPRPRAPLAAIRLRPIHQADDVH